MSDKPARFDAVVLGSGVLGLSIANQLVQRGYKIAVVAKDLASDIYSQGFASPWAGCNWRSFAAPDDDRAISWDRYTYTQLSALAQEQPRLCQRIPFYESGTKADLPWFSDFVIDFKVHENDSSLPSQWSQGYSFKSYILNAPLYLQHLEQKLRDRKVPFFKKRINALEELYHLPEVGPVGLVINASGLGAKALLGVEDPDAYPIRGQTVLVRSDVKTCYISSEHPAEHPDESMYIIPRPGVDAVILGGCFQEDSFNPLPDYAMAQRILERAYAVCPELAGPGGRGWQDIQIISHNVGFRPARRGGCRLELEELELGQPNPLAPASEGLARTKVAVLRGFLGFTALLT